MATLKLKEHGFFRSTRECTQSTLWLSALPNVTQKPLSPASKLRFLTYSVCFVDQCWHSIYLFFIGLLFMWRRIRSVGQLQQTPKQSLSCADRAQLYMKKRASCFFLFSYLCVFEPLWLMFRLLFRIWDFWTGSANTQEINYELNICC